VLAAMIGMALAPFPLHAEVAVDPALANYAPQAPLTGTISAAGDDDMETLMNGWVAVFRRAHPGVEIRLDVDSTATAAKALAAGAEIAFVGRKMLDPELAVVVAAWGHQPVPVVVAGGSYDDKNKTHAEFVWVNPANPLQGITLAQLDAIFGDELRQGTPRTITTWGDLGLTGEWADKPIHAFRHRSVGVTQFINETVLKGGTWRKTARLLDKAKEVPPAVAEDKYAIGLAGLGFANGLNVRALPIALSGGGGFVAPTMENIASRRYPLSRVVYLYVNQAPGKPLNPLVAEFLRAVLSKEGQLAAVRDGFLPLSHDEVIGAMASLN
jgi:phosphate transport system substrate-binding protein